MPQFSLNIQVDDAWVKYFNQYEYHLCFARVVQKVDPNGKPGEKVSNVIAHAEDVAAESEITWKDSFYGIAASTEGYSSHGKIKTSTPTHQIKPGRAAVLSSGTDLDISSSRTDLAPLSGFHFSIASPPSSKSQSADPPSSSSAPSAAAVIAQTINGKNRPIYITPRGALLSPGASEALIPQSSVVVWFQRDVETGVMMDGFRHGGFVVPISAERAGGSVFYDREGRWHVISQKVDYTRGRYEKYASGLGGMVNGHGGAHGGVNGYGGGGADGKSVTSDGDGDSGSFGAVDQIHPAYRYGNGVAHVRRTISTQDMQDALSCVSRAAQLQSHAISGKPVAVSS